MHVNLHANATTTPRVRAYIQASTVPVAELAKGLGVSDQRCANGAAGTPFRTGHIADGILGKAPV